MPLSFKMQQKHHVCPDRAREGEKLGGWGYQLLFYLGSKISISISAIFLAFYHKIKMGRDEGLRSWSLNKTIQSSHHTRLLALSIWKLTWTIPLHNHINLESSIQFWCYYINELTCVLIVFMRVTSSIWIEGLGPRQECYIFGKMTIAFYCAMYLIAEQWRKCCLSAEHMEMSHQIAWHMQLGWEDMMMRINVYEMLAIKRQFVYLQLATQIDNCISVWLNASLQCNIWLSPVCVDIAPPPPTPMSHSHPSDSLEHSWTWNFFQ